MSDKNSPNRLATLVNLMAAECPSLTITEFRAFLFVSDNEGTNITDVQGHLETTQSTTSRTVQRLNGESYGLIDCRPQGRQTRLFVSSRGRSILNRLAAALVTAIIAFHVIGLGDDPRDGMQGSTPGYELCTDPVRFECDVA